MNAHKSIITKDICYLIRRDVVLADISMTLYCMYLICTDNANVWIGGLFGFTPFGANMLLKACKLYDLCRIHKAMILHVLAVYGCMIYEYEVGFGIILAPMRWIMFTIGIVLITYLFATKIKEYQQWKKSRKNFRTS